MKRMWLIWIGCIFLLAGHAYAMDHSGGKMGAADAGTMGMHHGSRWWIHAENCQKINLTAEEQTKLNDMWIQHRRNMIDLEGRAAKEKFELEVLDDAADFDPAAFMKQFDKLQQIWTAMATERMKYRVDVRSLLGSDRFQQVSKYLPMFPKHKKGHAKACGCAMMDQKGMKHGPMGMMGGGGKGMMHGMMHGSQAAGGGCKMMSGRMQPEQGQAEQAQPQQTQPQTGQESEQSSSNTQ